MRKSLTTIGALLLVAGLAACNRGAGNGSDEERLNQAARTLDDDGVYDTSADDAALNQAELPANEAASANTVGTNAAAPANSAATGNRQ